MKRELDTSLFPFMDICFYDTQASPMNMFERDYEEMEEYEEETDFDFEKYKKDYIPYIQQYVNDYVLPVLDDVVSDIKVKSIWSPREYNFRIDQAVFDVEVDDDWRSKAIRDIPELKSDAEVNVIFESRYHSGPGFHFFGPETWEEFRGALLVPDSYDDDIILGMYLMFKLVAAQGLDFIRDGFDDICETFGGNHNYDEYATVVNTIDEEFIPYFKEGKEAARDELYWNVRNKYGYAWREDQSRDSEFMKMCKWAKKKGLSLEELEA